MSTGGRGRLVDAAIRLYPNLPNDSGRHNGSVALVEIWAQIFATPERDTSGRPPIGTTVRSLESVGALLVVSARSAGRSHVDDL